MLMTRVLSDEVLQSVTDLCQGTFLLPSQPSQANSKKYTTMIGSEFQMLSCIFVSKSFNHIRHHEWNFFEHSLSLGCKKYLQSKNANVFFLYFFLLFGHGPLCIHRPVSSKAFLLFVNVYFRIFCITICLCFLPIVIHFSRTIQQIYISLFARRFQ